MTDAARFGSTRTGCCPPTRGPGDRAAAVRGGARPADHLPARPRRPAAAARRRAVRGPGQPVRDAGPLRDPAAARQRGPAGRARRGPQAARRGRGPRGLAAALLALGRLPRHAGAVLAGGGAGRDLRRHGAPVRPRRPTRSTTRWPSGWPRTPTGRGRCSTGSASRCWPPPTTRATTCPPRRPRRRPDLGRAGHPDVPPGPLPGAGQPGWRDAVAGWARWPTSTPATTPASSQRWRARRATSSSTAPSRPTTATPTSAPTRWSRRGRPDLPRRAGRDRDRGRGGGVPPAHAAGDGPDVVRRRAGDDPAPGRAPRHHGPTTARVRRGHRQRHPGPVEFTDALRPLLERYGTHPNLHLVVFTLDETVFSRELAPLAGFYPRVRRGAVVVPRRPRRDPPVPRCGHRDRRLLPHVGVHRRHPRVLLDPGPPRHVRAARRRLPRPAGGRAPARRGRGPGDRASTW